MGFLDDLNEQQIRAVTAGLGQILVLAGPGSGKTRVLTQRITYLIQSMGIRPYQILAVTFTNKAAKEMMNRLTVLGEEASGIWLGTFHSICARILRREAKSLPFDSHFVIMDADDQVSLLRQIIKELNLDDKQYRPHSIHAAISQSKNNQILPSDFHASNYRENIISRIYQRYQETLTSNNALDFDDLLLWTVRLFEENSEIKTQYGRRFAHVLVDEFQDTNVSQYHLLHHLSSYHHNLFVVGDEDQSIYRWRGADYRNILRFENDHPDAAIILLEKNYRSTQNILNAARSVINQNINRTPKQLVSARLVDGDHIVLYEASDDQEEAIFVADNMARTIANGKVKGNELAVMYRTNAQSRLLENAFRRIGLPYRLVGAQRFYGRREVKDMIAYLRLVFNPKDEISLYRVINIPPRKIGAKKILELQTISRQSGCSAGEILLSLAEDNKQSPFYNQFSKQTASLFIDFASMLSDWRKSSSELSTPDLLDHIIEDVNYQNYIEENTKDIEEGFDRWENVQELRRQAFEDKELSLENFLENLALVSDQDTLPEVNEAPTLLTLHAAKGLEYSHVYIIGLDEGILPHNRSLLDAEEMEEERRLLYVGMTRAKNQLYLVRAERRSTFGSYEQNLPSRFLADIPENLLQYPNGRKYQPINSLNWRTSQRWEAHPAYSAPPSQHASIIQAKYKIGMIVEHDKWGEGIIIDCRFQDREETVDVAFESVGIKKLLASVAKLEIISEGKQK